MLLEALLARGRILLKRTTQDVVLWLKGGCASSFSDSQSVFYFISLMQPKRQRYSTQFIPSVAREKTVMKCDEFFHKYMNDISCKLNSQSFLISRRRCPKPSTTARGAKGKRQWDNGPQATSYAKFCQVMPPQPQVFWWSFHGCEGLTGLTAMVYLSNVYATDGC